MYLTSDDGSFDDKHTDNFIIIIRGFGGSDDNDGYVSCISQPYRYVKQVAQAIKMAYPQYEIAIGTVAYDRVLDFLLAYEEHAKSIWPPHNKIGD